jgi:hypothetical protein
VHSNAWDTCAARNAAPDAGVAHRPQEQSIKASTAVSLEAHTPFRCPLPPYPGLHTQCNHCVTTQALLLLLLLLLLLYLSGFL